MAACTSTDRKMKGKKISPRTIFASRAIIKQKEIRVDCVAFDDFFVP
jgi:hypothetical protein